MIEQCDLSQRRVCRLAGLSRDSYRHPPEVDPMTQDLQARIVQIAHVRGRFGYRRTHDLLRASLPGVNHKRVYWLYSAADLAVRKRRKTRLPACQHRQVGVDGLFDQTVLLGVEGFRLGGELQPLEHGHLVRELGRCWLA